jgi:hypothetical protein
VKLTSIPLIIVLALALLAAVNYSQPAPCRAVTPINAFANVRSSPALGDNIVGQLARGQVAAVTATAGSLWYRTAAGYVHSSVVVCADLPTATPVQPTLTRLPSLTPTATPTVTATTTPITPGVILRICIHYEHDVEPLCSLFLEPVTVRIERMP